MLRPHPLNRTIVVKHVINVVIRSIVRIVINNHIYPIRRGRRGRNHRNLNPIHIQLTPETNELASGPVFESDTGDFVGALLNSEHFNVLINKIRNIIIIRNIALGKSINL